jgi:hypothetical protein
VRSPRLLAGLLGAGLVLSSCTLVPTNESLVKVSRQAVPFGLLAPTIPGTINGRVTFVTQPIYIVDATGHLTVASRVVPSPPGLDEVLRELLRGPTAIERSAGYSSALPGSVVLLQATMKGTVAFISLAKPLSSLPRGKEVLAVAQLALTAYTVGATSGIKVLVAGIGQPLLLPGGARASEVNAQNYVSLLSH